jgi:tripartite-type tricarboxylate transporter receptor subunit TctC
MQEAGLPGFVTASWLGMVGPRDMPAALATRISSEVKRALNAPELREKMIGYGAEVVASTADEFDAYIRSEMTKWGNVAKHINLKPE